MIDKIIYEINDTKKLLRAVPSGAMALFCISVVLMNLLANKEVYTGVDWFALDFGIMLSWLSFLCMDIVTKRFGPKASVKISLVAVAINLGVCVVLKIVSVIPGNWSAFYTFQDQVVNQAIDSTVGGTWYVLFGSTVAMLVASVVNAITNHAIGKRVRSSDFKAFALRSYVSTMLAQFVDNMVFTLIVSYHFFGWSLLQCVTCSLTGCIVELLCEVIFSPIGYSISRSWEKENVGADYLGGSKCN